MAATKFTLTVLVGEGHDARKLHLQGRVAWALDKLHRAGDRGCTPIDTPGPRWSDYVFKLKRRYGVSIETVHESHGGAFAGTHARYVLRSSIRILHGGDSLEVAA
jgi:hypothetical protein